MDHFILFCFLAVAAAVAYVVMRYRAAGKTNFRPVFWKIFIPTLYAIPVYWLVLEIVGVKVATHPAFFEVEFEIIACIFGLAFLGLALWRIIPGFYKGITVLDSAFAVLGAVPLFWITLLLYGLSMYLYVNNMLF
ncbi:hypothetical protein LJC46_00560 [Desulfovibrio sp. OttesenSCG-928-G15]|nr:hypothetical protein [Desulfovibrio sp. OttesenSCG-928-G15]